MNDQEYLPPIAIDFETYYDPVYSLKRMSIVDYVMDPRFEVIGFSFTEIFDYSTPEMPGRIGAQGWYTGTDRQIRAWLDQLQLHRRTVIIHNAFFDGAILEWKFNQRPRRYFCTMMGSRPYVAPFTGSASLAKVAEFLDLSEKGDTVARMAGMQRIDITGPKLQEYADYCRRDSKIAAEAYLNLVYKFPDDELDLIHLTVEKFLRGRLVLDKGALLAAQREIEDAEAKAQLILAAVGLTREAVVSNVRLAVALTARGVPVPTKVSVTTGKQTTAMSKKDPEFIALRSHPNPEVRNIIECRLLLKSSIERTRIAQFLAIADHRPTLPVPLMYYGAHTGRFSGSMGINLQNLPRGSALRNAIVAPDGYKVVTVDLASIEARITATLANEWGLVEMFRTGQDVYSNFATDLYGYPVSDCDATKTERFVGKMCILGLGFGMGGDKFDATMESTGVRLDGLKGKDIVQVYRGRFPRIPHLWRRMDGVLSKMMELPPNAWMDFTHGQAKVNLLRVERGKLTLPNGMPIFYPGMTRGPYNQLSFKCYETPSKVYDKNIWGGALTENVVQALARIILSKAELRLAAAGLKASLQVHDELVYVVPEHAVGKVEQAIRLAVTAPIPWMPELPLACKIGAGDTYGEAK